MQTISRTTAPDLNAISLREAGQAILGEGGVLSQLLPGYEARQPQVELANLVGDVLDTGGHALVEAGTGVGKSFGYLIPAILSVLQKGGKVVVSTDTIQLQEQLIKKDLPFLEEALGRPILFAIAKGRSNFGCQRNAQSFLQEFGPAFPGISGPIELALKDFLGQLWDGDKSNLTVPVPDNAWAEMAADDTCEGRSCKFRNGCALLQAKEQLEKADIIVTNHTMYMVHCFVKSRTGDKGILPEHNVWIADEAHTLPEKAQDVFGVELSQFKPGSFIKRVERQAKALDIDLQDIDPKTIDRASKEFFQWFHGAHKNEQLLEDFPEAVLDQAKAAGEALVQAIRPVTVQLDRAAARVSVLDVERRFAVAALADSAKTLIGNIRAVFRDPVRNCPVCCGGGWSSGGDPNDNDPCPACAGSGEIKDDNVVRYVEIAPGRQLGEKIAKIHVKPAETAGIFRGVILPELDSAVFLSATLATGTGANAFKAIAEELGLTLKGTRTMQAGSPFDYASQVQGYLSPFVPDAKDPSYHTHAAREIARVLNHTQGRAFVLFTSTRDMNRVYDLLVGTLDYPLLIQGSKPKDLLVAEFKATPNAVLLAVNTFWTGVDIPGDALSCVIIPKLPFPAPSPLSEARCRKIEQRGGSGFRDYSLPRCTRMFLQGFGRLIRSSTDTGLFVCLDQRLRPNGPSYGQSILRALPTFQWVREL